VSGLTASNYITVEYHGNNTPCNNWKLTVKAASSNFTNGTDNVPVQYISVRYNGTGGNTVALSSSEQPLIQNGGTISGYYFTKKLDMLIQGGSQLAVSNGTYSANVIFYLRDNNGSLVSSWTGSINFQVNYQGPNLQDYCPDITLSGYGSYGYTFNTYAQLMAGATVTDAVSLSYQLVNNCSNCPDWKLTVKAASPYFSNGTDNIPVTNSALVFNRTEGTGPSGSAIGITSGSIPLSTSETTIINQSNARLQAPPDASSFTQKYDLAIQGGAYLIKPTTGPFTVDLIFTLYDGEGQLISTTTITSVGFQNQYSGGGITLSLQNGGNAADFDFSTIANRANGISLVKNNALKITAYQDYKVYAQTISDDLVATTTSHTIPVSIIHLTAGLSTPISGVTCNTIQLSSNNTQPLIDDTNTDYPHQTVEYNLTYFINGSDPNLLNVPAATYSGTLIFVAQPN
jgi:hypothetical protein